MTGAVLSMAKLWPPVKPPSIGTLLPSTMPVMLVRSSRKVPLPDTPLTCTSQVVPPSAVLGVPMLPTASVPDRENAAAVTPVTGMLKATANVTVPPWVTTGEPTAQVMPFTVGAPGISNACKVRPSDTLFAV